MTNALISEDVMVKIFSGDDTDFRGDQRLALTFSAPDVDFTGCTAELEFLGQRRTFANLANGGRLAFAFSSDETRGMRCGVWPVTIRLRDAAGRVRTVDNTQRIKVTDDVNEAYSDAEQELAVSLRSGGVAMPEIPADLDAAAADSVGDFKRKFNALLGLLRGAAALAVMLGAFHASAASVATTPLDDIPGTSCVVTNVTFDGLAKSNELANVASSVSTLWEYAYGKTVWLAVTNYMRTVAGTVPSLQLWEVRGGATNLVYSSIEEITNEVAKAEARAVAYASNGVEAVRSEIPSSAWSRYQSATGAEAPHPGVMTMMTTPYVQLSGGYEWTKYTHTQGSVWLLKSTGLSTAGGDGNGFWMKDDEGSNVVSITKTASQILDAVPSSVGFDASGNFQATFLGTVQPVLYTANTLTNGVFDAEGDDPNITVTWTEAANTNGFTATVAQTVKSPSLFVYGKVEQPGGTLIKAHAPVEFTDGVMIGGVKYAVGVDTVGGKTVLTLTSAVNAASEAAE